MNFIIIFFYLKKYIEYYFKFIYLIKIYLHFIKLVIINYMNKLNDFN